MSETKPNPDDINQLDGRDPNLDGGDDGTGGESDLNNSSGQDPELGIDYKKKFSESTTENQRIQAENRRIEEENERLRAELRDRTPSDDRYPGFNDLDEEEQKNVGVFTDHVVDKAKKELEKDPAIAHARRTYAETTFNNALDAVVAKFPDLAETKADFKTKYFNPNNVPDNIEALLGDLAKIWLFDKAKAMGAAEEKDRQGRLDTERITGGERHPRTSRTLEEWQRIAQANPAKFASMKKEYEADLATGQLAE